MPNGDGGSLLFLQLGENVVGFFFSLIHGVTSCPLSLSYCNAGSLPLAFSEPPPEITVYFLLHIHISIIMIALPSWEMESLVV